MEACVFIVDGDPATRDAVSAITASMRVKAEAYASAEEFLEAFNEFAHRLSHHGVRLPGMSGLELLKKLCGPPPRIPPLVLTAYADVPLVVKAMSLGAFAVFEKPYRADKLREAISQAVEMGRQWWEEGAKIREIDGRLQTLTPQERHVLDWIMTGKTNRAIAEKLGVGVRTVESRRSAIMTKMRVRSLVELVQFVLKVQSPHGPGPSSWAASSFGN